MFYYKSLKINDNLIISCDMIRLSFNLNNNTLVLFNKFINSLSLKNSIYEFHSYTSLKMFSYRTLITFDANKNFSFVVGLGFNSAVSSEKNKCFIEFNPNKCLSTYFVNPILDFIKEHANFVEIVRFDFAIDIPVKRELLTLQKDLRKYQKHFYVNVSSNSLSNITEYLGTRNSNGFVKVYNKTIEQNLDYDVTRVEITLDNFKYDNFIKNLPTFYYFDNENFNLFDFNSLNNTDKVLLSLINDNINYNVYLKMLGRGKKEKFEKFFKFRKQLFVSELDFYKFCDIVFSIFNGFNLLKK